MLKFQCNHVSTKEITMQLHCVEISMPPRIVYEVQSEYTMLKFQCNLVYTDSEEISIQIHVQHVEISMQPCIIVEISMQIHHVEISTIL